MHIKRLLYCSIILLVLRALFYSSTFEKVSAIQIILVIQNGAFKLYCKIVIDYHIRKEK